MSAVTNRSKLNQETTFKEPVDIFCILSQQEDFTKSPKLLPTNTLSLIILPPVFPFTRAPTLPIPTIPPRHSTRSSRIMRFTKPRSHSAKVWKTGLALLWHRTHSAIVIGIVAWTWTLVVVLRRRHAAEVGVVGIVAWIAVGKHSVWSLLLGAWVLLDGLVTLRCRSLLGGEDIRRSLKGCFIL